MMMSGLRPFSATRDARSEAASFDALFRDCAADVHAYALSLLGERAAAEDVTAQSFERLFRSRRRLDPRRGTPRTLLFTIARNAALDELRRCRRRPLAEASASERLAAEPAAVILESEDVERRETVRRALAELSARDREIVLLKFHGQLTNSELAQALGISESNAGTRLSRALAKLRAGSLGAEEVA